MARYDSDLKATEKKQRETFVFPIMTKKLEYQSSEVPPPSSTRTNGGAPTDKLA